MASIWQFVADLTSASPTVLFDLNNAANGIRVRTDWKIGPTLFEKGYSGGPLRHGKKPTRSSATNQILEIPVEINRSTATLAAQKIEDLVRQLAVDNFLKVQLDGATPVFFRTFGDADFAAAVRSVLIQDTSITLSIEAEPFAYGPRVEVPGSPFTVSNNPASANGCLFDISGVLGDMETPLLLVATSTGASGAPSGLVNKWVHIGARRRLDPTFLDHLIQGEAMTQGTGAVVTADAAMSNGSKSRIGFGTPTETLRLSDTFPESGVAGMNARGEYIVYARVAKTVAGDTITCRIGYGASSTNPVMNDVKTLPAGAAGPYWVELGKLPVPPWSSPGTIGLSGIHTSVLLSFFGFYAARTAGSGSLDVDCFFFMPADDQTLIAKFPSTDTTYAIDATTDAGGSVYGVNTGLTDEITTQTPAQIVAGGGFPQAIPGQTCRFYMLRQVDPAGTVDALTDTTTIRAYYWPRWREFTRP